MARANAATEVLGFGCLPEPFPGLPIIGVVRVTRCRTAYQLRPSSLGGDDYGMGCIRQWFAPECSGVDEPITPIPVVGTGADGNAVPRRAIGIQVAMTSDHRRSSA